MADEKNQEEAAETKASGGGSPVMLIVAVVVILAVAGGAFMMMNQGPKIEEAKPLVEFVIKEKMYQLKDGSYLKLGFSIVIEVDKLAPVKEIIEKESPGRLPNGINMIVGNKSREDIINGTHKREAFARELKKMLEERVF
ncbi:MAG: hypothetical protein ACI8RA_002868, partial [Chlamydiales bacterium]